MIFGTIRNVALFEMKSLLRSRIFLVYCFAVLVFLLTGMVLVRSDPALSSFIPCCFSKHFLIAQAVFALLIASESMARELRLNSNDSLYVRSFGNTSFIFGKTAGILIILSSVAVVFLIFTALVHLGKYGDLPLQPVNYVYYFFLMTLPAMVFFTGISFFTTAFFRYQAVTLIAMLIFLAISLVYPCSAHEYAFDSLCRVTPFAHSDFIGFGNLPFLLGHRLMYLFAGFGFIIASIPLLNRFPQEKTGNGLLIAAAVALLTLSSVLMYANQHVAQKGITMREVMNDLEKQYAASPRPVVTSCNLSLVHKGDKVEGEAVMTIRNDSEKPMERLILRLNPGLAVTGVESSAKSLSHERYCQVLVIVPPCSALQSSASLSLTIRYEGIIDENAVFASIEEKERRRANLVHQYCIGKRYAVVSPSYVLLTADALWYPLPLEGDGRRDFIDFPLKVATDPSLTVLSQGKAEESGGTVAFTPETKLTQRSLIIGKYEKKTAISDGTEWSVYTLKNHDYFMRYFSQLGEEMPKLISLIKSFGYEKAFGNYPFRRMSLIEVPIQFYAYFDTPGLLAGTVQPEQLLIAEKGAYVLYGKIKALYRSSHKKNLKMTEEDCQRSTFINFCKQMFFDVSTQRQIAAYRKQEIEESGATDDTRGMGTEIPLLEVDYHVFPESYHFINGFSSDSHPVFDSVVGSVLKEKSEHELTTEYQGKTHIPLKIQALRALSNHSLKELSIDPDCRDIYREALRLKSDYFFAYFPQKYGIARNTFETVLCDFLKEHRFETVGFDTFDTTVEERFGVRMESDFKRWYEDVAMPYYEAYDFKYHKIIHDGSEKYQVYFSVYNRSKYDGVFSAMMYSDKDGHCENLFYIGGNEARQFGMLMSGPPTYGLRIDPLVSRHYWFIDNYLDRYEGDLNAAPFEGSRVIDAPIPAYDEIIVDNLDPGFQIVSQPPVSIVKRLLSGKGRDTGNDFKPLDVNAIPGRWSYCFEEQFYGKPEPSAFYIRPGKGDYSVSFTADITEPGKYHIFFYSPQRLVGMRVSTDSYHFRVYHENLVDEASISMEKLEDAWANINNYHLKGWIPLGTYVFTKGPAKVELTDKSDALYVFADAVKWVKQ